MREDHEVADLLEDDPPDDVGEAGGVQGVGDAPKVEVHLGRGQEVDLKSEKKRKETLFKREYFILFWGHSL